VKIRPAEAELFRADRQYVTKLTNASRNSANEPNLDLRQRNLQTH